MIIIIPILQMNKGKYLMAISSAQSHTSSDGSVF